MTKQVGGTADPTVLVALRQLVAQHGRDAVQAACETACKRMVVEASREQLARLRVIIDALRGCWERDQVMRLCMLHKTKGVPVEITLEVLDRVVDIRPANPWGLINTIMRKDYPRWA